MRDLFEKKYIIKLYLWNSYEEIPIDLLIPFVDARIDTWEEKLFEGWEDHFQGKRLSIHKPYVITIDPKKKKKTLWIKSSTKEISLFK